jgi:cell division protein FtsB
MSEQTDTRAIERPAIPRPGPRRVWSRVMLFVASALLANGLFGERGLTEMRRARRAYGDAVSNLARLKRENAALRAEAERLRSDPAAIEALARKDLGLLRRGELLFTIRDLQR